MSSDRKTNKTLPACSLVARQKENEVARDYFEASLMDHKLQSLIPLQGIYPGWQVEKITTSTQLV